MFDAYHKIKYIDLTADYIINIVLSKTKKNLVFDLC